MARHNFKIPFVQWIKQFQHDKSDKGMFVRLVLSNSEFSKYESKMGIIKFMKKMGATTTLISIFLQLWSDFESVPSARIRISHNIPTIKNHCEQVKA